MTHENDAERELSREDADFVDRLRQRHAPEPMPAGRRAVFLNELSERLATRPRRRALIGALLAPAAALVLAWLYLSGSPAPFLDDGPATVVAEAEDARWAYEVLYPPELNDTEDLEDSQMLPDDYLAIGSELLDS
jgi:anti-sigma factor RsiW